jgi:hypothetical protein
MLVINTKKDKGVEYEIISNDLLDSPPLNAAALSGRSTAGAYNQIFLLVSIYHLPVQQQFTAI